MTIATLQPDNTELGVLEEIVGYLNFSSGASDPKFLRNLDALFGSIERRLQSGEGPDGAPVAVLCRWLRARMEALSGKAAAFGDITQARAAVDLLEHHLLPAYRHFHSDLLRHQSDTELWRPLFLGRAFEALLDQGPPWDESERIVGAALDALNDYLGYRPVAVLESEREMEPYPHEWVRPVPLYVREVGVACGPYEELLRRALAILSETDPDILQQAWFDPQLVDELSLDPRAYEFDHPASKRPNHHFGQWDLHQVDNRGYYRRFVLQQITLDALMSRVDSLASGNSTRGRSAAGANREELMFEAAAVLAGTILMASGTTGNGPGCHSSDVSLSTLLPHIAKYRDQFYEQLLERTGGAHGERLRAESQHLRQPFGGARQHLNHELARRRARQMQHVHLAQLYARMGYPEAALKEAHTVRIASARMLCQIYCSLTAGHHAVDARQLDAVARYLDEIEDLLRRGIECGALVDPWNIVGFGANYSLFPAIENTVRDFRVDDLIELVEQIFDLAARAWTEAAAIDDPAHEAVFSAALARLAGWWDKYATASVSGVKRLVGKEIEISTNLVAGAMAAWHKAGAAAGDVKFWRMFVDQFDSPKAFQLVVEALLDRGDQVASMALMLQWVSQVERTPLDDGDASFHPLAMRWLRAVEAEQHVDQQGGDEPHDKSRLEETGQRGTGEDGWSLVAKFFAHLEASAEAYWRVPEFELEELLDDELSDLDDEPAEHALEAADVDEDWDDDQEDDELYSAAYEDVVYRDSTDDGFDADMMDESGVGSEFELEEEAQRLGLRLEFLSTVAGLWRHAAIAWGPTAARQGQRREQFQNWHEQAVSRFHGLLELVDAVHRFAIPQPGSSYDSMVEYDQQRMIKDSLLEQALSTCVETADAARLLAAASGRPVESLSPESRRLVVGPAVKLLRGVLSGNVATVRRHWRGFLTWLGRQELLYVPLAKGGRPRRIVRARAHGQLIRDLLGWLPRLGLIRETCQLLDIAQAMESGNPVGPGAVTEYDRLFAVGYQAMVRCLVASADTWDEGRTPEPGKRGRNSIATEDFGGAGSVSNQERLPTPSTQPVAIEGRSAHPSWSPAIRLSDTMLVEALQDLTEAQLHRWLAHSRTLRLSVVERLASDQEWQAFVAFVERYGADLFTQKFLNLGNLRAILHQRASVWLSNLEQDPEFEDLRLVQELGTELPREEAAKWLTIAIEAIAENYREYRDYNTTTTHSDHGELLFTLVDFLRLRAAYDRVAWNLRPVVMAHEILVRQDRPAAAELWQQALADRTAEAAETNLARFDQLCEQYGVRLATVSERLAERFTRPLSIDRVQALVAPAMAAADSGDLTAFGALEEEIASLASEPTGAGLDLPDWLNALEEEVSQVRCARRHREGGDDVLPRLEQVRLSWEDWQRQISSASS